jgi:hypothetical protein
VTSDTYPPGSTIGGLAVTPAAEDTRASGPILFARYAFPPNHRGSCGPADSVAFFESGTQGVEHELQAMAREFAGAWPYLQLIAGATGLSDPLDRRAVEAYWIGSPRLDRVAVTDVGNSMEDRFRFRSGPRFSSLTEGVLAGGKPHHSFHVFLIYPWIGLLHDDRRAEQALTVLDQCRIRWGKVLVTSGDQVMVESSHLTWDGRRLDLGPPQAETVERSIDGIGLASPLEAGDWVSMHWEWVCDRLTGQQLRALQYYTRRHLDIVNEEEQAGPLGRLT